MKQAENILSLIPQRPPFVMVDELLFCDECSTKSSFRIMQHNVLVFNGKLSEAGLMENIAQTVAAGTGYKANLDNIPVTVGYIGSVKNFEVFELPKIGDELVTEIKIENRVFDMTVISGTVKRNDELIAQCEMNIFISK
ncbi:MAG: 3-hydroxyacyl-ACP dehydratase [Mucilaginibacter sp.]|nr:3-hydroxyacyl-ACP dehydratase [Mucilaginibacter sp.]